MKRAILSTAVLLSVVMLLSGCGAEEKEEGPVIAVSESFEQTEQAAQPDPTDVPLPTVEPTSAPVVLVEYKLGGTSLILPDDYAASASYDGGFMLTGSASIITGDWYDADRFSYLYADYPETSDELADLLLPQEREILNTSSADGRTVVESVEDDGSARWASYTVYVRGESICWAVDFICPEAMYEQMRPSFEEWAGSMILPDSAEEAGRHEMTSVTGLFTLALPADCIVIDEAVTPASLAVYGMQEEDAAAFLDEIRSRAAGQDVVCCTDFAAMMVVSVDPDAGMTQNEMLGQEDELYIEESLAGEDYTYEGIVMLDDNPNAFYFVRVDHGDYEELGFTTFHDDSGVSITFSFTGFTDDEAGEILKTLDMQARSD